MTSDPGASDAAHLEWAGRGDERAFAVLLDRHHHAVYRFARSVTRDDAQAEEAVQEAFVRLFLHGRAVRSAAPWLCRTVMNLHLDQRRAAARSTSLTQVTIESAPQLQVQASGGIAAEEEDRRHILQKAVESLDPELADVLRCRFYAELKYEEIADALGIPLGTVCSRLRRALQELGARLENTPLARGDA